MSRVNDNFGTPLFSMLYDCILGQLGARRLLTKLDHIHPSL
jgi:hypothetical protein